MEPIIHNAVQKALMERTARRPGNMLYVTDLAKNPYAAIKRVLTGELEVFDYPTQLKMDGGKALEKASLREIAENIGRPSRTYFPLFNQIWTGEADMIIGHGSQDVIVVDHKGSAGEWWDYKESLPRSSDCLQIWQYGQLYHEQFGIWPQLRIYYRGWGTWGDFQIHEIKSAAHEIHLQAAGYITDKKGKFESQVRRIRRINPYWLRQELEQLYNLAMNGSQLDAIVTDPGGPDWDYPENATERLKETMVG